MPSRWTARTAGAEEVQARYGARYEDLEADAPAAEDVPPAAKRARLKVLDGSKA